MTDGKNTANEASVFVASDRTMSGWSVEVSHADNWDFVQLASVNEKSDLRIASDDSTPEIEETVPFTGWRVTLDRDALLDHISHCEEVLRRMA